MDFNVRTPIIALDYTEKYKAVPKELMVDYETGNIYIVSSRDKNIIFDITSKIKEKIDSLDGGKIDIIIDGIGKVSLTDIISRLRNEMENSVHIIDTGDDTAYVGQECVPDNKSIEFSGRDLQIKGFNKAPNLSIPRIKDGLIEWIATDDLLIPTSGGDNNESNGDVIPPSNPKDGRQLYCYEIAPLNEKLFLRASKRQKSYYIPCDCRVILPKTIDEYSEIEWYVVTNSHARQFIFERNILWRNQTVQPVSNGHHIYKFKSWDYGETWLGELIVYDRNTTSGAIDSSYLSDNFFNKKQIQEMFYDKEKTDDVFVSKEQLQNDYLDKNNLSNNYCSKEDISKLLAWKKAKTTTKEEREK